MGTVVCRLALATVVVFAAISCAPSKTACEADQFFCARISTWEASATRLSTRRVMELHAVDWRFNRPATNIFARILGTRGDETLRELVAFMESHPDVREETFYSPVLSEVSFSSHVDLCRSQYRPALLNLTKGAKELRC